MEMKFGYRVQEASLWEDLRAFLQLKKPLLLIGPTGSGKTKLAEALAQSFELPMNSINCSVDLDAEALLGFKTIVQQDGVSVIEFVDGPVVDAMKHGHILYIDEINMAKPETLPILHSVLDYRRTLTNPFTGEVIEAHPDFKVLAAINEGYVGTTPMNEALKNRFVAARIDYLTGDALRQLLAESVDLEDERLDMMYNIAIELQKQVKEGLLAEEIASIRSVLDALQLSAHMPIERALQYAIVEKIEDPLERDLVLQLIEMWV